MKERSTPFDVENQTQNASYAICIGRRFYLSVFIKLISARSFARCRKPFGNMFFQGQDVNPCHLRSRLDIISLQLETGGGSFKLDRRLRCEKRCAGNYINHNIIKGPTGKKKRGNMQRDLIVLVFGFAAKVIKY